MNDYEVLFRPIFVRADDEDEAVYEALQEAMNNGLDIEEVIELSDDGYDD